MQEVKILQATWTPAKVITPMAASTAEDARTGECHGCMCALFSGLRGLDCKSISSRLRPPRPNPAVIIAGLDENQAWGAPNFQPAPQLYARKSAFLTYFYK
jgi:hypothetical protein